MIPGVAHHPVQFLEGVGHIAAALMVDDLDLVAGMDVVEGEPPDVRLPISREGRAETRRSRQCAAHSHNARADGRAANEEVPPAEASVAFSLHQFPRLDGRRWVYAHLWRPGNIVDGPP